MSAPARPLTRHTDARGVTYVNIVIRVTGTAGITALENLCATEGASPARTASALVCEELWYLSVPGMRDHVRRSRAERRHRYAPRQDTR